MSKQSEYRHPERSVGSPRPCSVQNQGDPSLRSGRRELSLKQILFNIARLPSIDQNWIMRRLSGTELNTFKQYHGLELLQEAQHFRTLKAGDACLPLKESPKPLPELCQQLAMKAPLYAAIVIEQGSYAWSDLFLEQFDTNGTIRAALSNRVLDIKSGVKQAIFSEWERSVSFDSMLDDDVHG